jgi:hypothetical protein
MNAEAKLTMAVLFIFALSVRSQQPKELAHGAKAVLSGW